MGEFSWGSVRMPSVLGTSDWKEKRGSESKAPAGTALPFPLWARVSDLREAANCNPRNEHNLNWAELVSFGGSSLRWKTKPRRAW